MRRPSLWLLGLGALLAADCLWQSAALRDQTVKKPLFAIDTLMEFYRLRA